MGEVIVCFVYVNGRVRENCVYKINEKNIYFIVINV